MLDYIRNKCQHQNVKSLFILLNLQMALSPIIVPHVFSDAGILLSLLLTALILVACNFSSSFTLEAIEHLKHLIWQQEILKKSLLGSVQSPVNQMDEQNDGSQNQLNIRKVRDQTIISHPEIFQACFSPNFKYVPLLIIFIFLGGATISKCIIAGQMASQVFSGIAVLELFQFWLGVFFLIGALFSFRCLEGLAQICEPAIILIRYLSLVFCIIGLVFIISNNQIPTFQKEMLFKIQSFSPIYSNLVFCLSYQFYISEATDSAASYAQKKQCCFRSILISGIFITIISIGCSLAFDSDDLTANGNYLSSLFKAQFVPLYYLLSFYVFISVDVFAIYVIVIRTNLFKALNLKIDPRQFSLKTVGTTLSLRAIIFVGSLYLKNSLQLLIDITGGIFGAIILFILPAVEVIRARKLTKLQEETERVKIILPASIITLGVVLMVLSLSLMKF